MKLSVRVEIFGVFQKKRPHRRLEEYPAYAGYTFHHSPRCVGMPLTILANDVFHQPEPAILLGREDGLGMELHRLDRQFSVAHPHNHAVVGFGGHLEARREGLAIGEKGVIPAYLKPLRKAFEHSFPGVRHPGRLPVDRVPQDAQRAAESLHHALQSEAHSKDGNALPHRLLHHIGNAEVRRAARTGEIRIRFGAIFPIISSGKPARYVTTSAPVWRA